MIIEPIHPSALEVGQDVTAWFKPKGSHGQGGVIVAISVGVFSKKMVTLRSGTAGHLNRIDCDEIHHWTIERPYEAEHCLEYGPDCEGPVEDWYIRGNRSWPRCEKHGQARLDAYENSMERYADSDVVPDWFDPSYAGERWEED